MVGDVEVSSLKGAMDVSFVGKLDQRVDAEVF